MFVVKVMVLLSFKQMKVAEPWSIYEGRLSAISAGRISLEAAFAQFVLARIGFPSYELTEIMTAAPDDGENDAARCLVELQSEWMVDAFVSGQIDTFARPIGGGTIVQLPSDAWEIDDFLSRFATGTINLEHWAQAGADPTHRILIDEQQFLNWMRALQRPEHLSKEQIERIADPSYVAPTDAGDATRQEPNHDMTDGELLRNLPLTATDLPAGVGPKLLSLKEVEAKIGLKKSTIYNWIEDDKFPSPLALGSRSLWREDEIDQWIAEQPRRS